MKKKKRWYGILVTTYSFNGKGFQHTRARVTEVCGGNRYRALLFTNTSLQIQPRMPEKLAQLVTDSLMHKYRKVT